MLLKKFVLKIECENSIRRLSFLCRLRDIKIAWNKSLLMILKPYNVILKPLNVTLKPPNVIEKPCNVIPKSQNVIPKLHNVITKPHNSNWHNVISKPHNTRWPTKMSLFFFGNNFYRNKENFKVFSPQILEVHRILLM